MRHNVFQSGDVDPASEPTGTTSPQPAPAPAPHDPDMPGLSPGQRLTAARRNRGLTHEDIAPAHVPLSTAILRALETEDTERLPPFAITQGMLRSYAEHLGLDAVALVRQWRAEVQKVEEPVAAEPPRRGVLPLLWGAGAAGLAVAMIAGVWFGVSELMWAADPAPAPVVATAPSTTTVLEALNTAPAAAREVRIVATRLAWLEARGPDGAIYVSRIMAPGETYTPELGAGWTVHARDAGAFVVVVDGIETGTLGEPGTAVLSRRVDQLAVPVSEAANGGGRPG
jgi:hypothetical protein